ncbi:MAG: DsbC family protein [Azoarcus sp.]|jgi:thiol:disulfide interchange protein DsbC|nr:DsbC family protein [Azoarcus sp.]
MRINLAVVVFALLFGASGIHWLRSGDGEPLTPQEALEAVLAEVDGEIDLAELPLRQALVQGDGALTLVTFEDPNCPYCAELDEKLALLDDATIYTFLLPVLSEDSESKARRIWCAPDRTAAWKDWMLNHRPPSGAGDCDTSALNGNLDIAEQMGIQSVPYLLRAKE